MIRKIMMNPDMKNSLIQNIKAFASDKSYEYKNFTFTHMNFVSAIGTYEEMVTILYESNLICKLYSNTEVKDEISEMFSLIDFPALFVKIKEEINGKQTNFIKQLKTMGIYKSETKSPKTKSFKKPWFFFGSGYVPNRGNPPRSTNI